MRNPAGEECRFFYQDFHRGRAIRECRNVAQNERSQPWRPGDCANCPVPAILRANADAALVLQVTIAKPWFGFGRRLTVSARCNRHQQSIKDPYVGCADCLAERPGLDLFRSALNQDVGEGGDDP